MAGALGGMLLAQFAGHLLAATGSFALLFAAAASAYLAALLLLHALSPQLSPVVLASPASTLPSE
jgi:ACS family hexuronate transporter-like MFS transporter